MDYAGLGSRVGVAILVDDNYRGRRVRIGDKVQREEIGFGFLEMWP